MTRTLIAPLTAHHQRFVDAYMEHRVASRAAIQAGYSGNMGGNLMARPDVQAEINRRLALCRKQAEISEQTIAQELAKVAFADPAELFDEEGRLLTVPQMPETIRRAIASVEVEALYEGHGKDRMEVGTTTKIKFWGKVQALEDLAKYKGMFIERHEVRGAVTYVIQAPTPAPDSLAWAKNVHAQIVAEG